ncbi:hypothetical protein J5N97_025693 [Dioscorea zingiberensis]|uniref:Transmembrane 9 superfamily member n=1 Tax=Dioscorea zingiberensis TaxID=325984 RepID=A0A9D5C192_9LILI|nr:hypothetical protein J5N97_025693 [Dioscorea zingiberensis]
MGNHGGVAVILLSFLLFACSARAFYLPGVAPRDFQKDDELQVKVNKLSSTKTQLPYDYYFLEYCKPSKIMNNAENLGEVLRGDRIENSVYTFKMRNDESCKVACRVLLNSEAAKNFKEKIEDEYRVNMILDNLPVAVVRQRRDESQTPSYEHGFHVGLKGSQLTSNNDDRHYINNHLSFKVMYHKDLESEDARIVGFEVIPSSIKHEYDEWDEKNLKVATCNTNSKITPTSHSHQEVAENAHVVFSYDVTFQPSEIKWASRWDTYLLMNDDQIHWLPLSFQPWGLMTAMVLLWVFMGLFAGYSSARLYKMFIGHRMEKNALKTAFIFPGILFSIFFVLNALIWGEKSSGAVPFGTMFALVFLWFGISVPLVFVGSFLGFKKPAIEDPVKTNKIPGRYLSRLGICSQLSPYSLVLCSEDYHWWWRAYLTAGSSALYLFLYSAFYFFSKLEITKFVSGILYFGYMLIVSYAFFVLTGTIGFYACFWFVVLGSNPQFKPSLLSLPHWPRARSSGSSGGCGELLQVGNSVSYEDCNELIQACADLVESLEGHGESSANSHDVVPMRLTLWCLDPLILKHDISEILWEKVRRPFLRLKDELHDKLAWRSMIICLVASPTTFAETRALLHSWFLMTGLASILELKAAIVSAVLDVLSKPMWWGVPMELALKFPFSYAYFPNVHQDLLSILIGPISCERFLELVHHIVMTSSSAEKHIYPSKPSHSNPEHAACDYTTVAYNSTWAILMDFPAWFYYATTLIFCQNDSPGSVLSRGMRAEAVGSKELHEAAVVFISWVLCPLNQVHFDLLVNLLNDMSRSWASNYLRNSGYGQWPCSDTHNKTTPVHGKKLRISKVSSYEKRHITQADESSLRIRMWLSEFHSHCARFYCISAGEKSRQSSSQQPNLLLIKVPLGILLSCPSDLDEKSCDLVLHYASTGDILNLEELQSGRNSYYNNHTSCSGGIYGKWALDGIILVFNLIDIVEYISVFLFDCEDTQFDFVGHVRGNVSSYLLHCVKVLNDFQSEQFQIDEFGGRDTLLDLYRRLMHWRDQSKKTFGEYRVFDDFLDNFAKRFCLSSYQDKVS